MAIFHSTSISFYNQLLGNKVVIMQIVSRKDKKTDLEMLNFSKKNASNFL